MSRAILLLDVANLVDPLLHWRNLRFDSITEQAQVGWDRTRGVLDQEWNTVRQIRSTSCAVLVLLELECTLHLLMIANLTFACSQDLRIVRRPIGLKLPEIDESLPIDLSGKRLGFRVLVEVEGPRFLIGIAGSRSVDYKGAVSRDVVKHDLNNRSLVKNNLIIIIIKRDDHFHGNINYFYTI